MFKKWIKRLIDFVLSLVMIILLSPILILVYVLVQNKLGRPAVFKQERPGLQGNVFTMYKFRSMADERDGNGELLPDAVRLTTFGKLLRASSLDELPELFNILRGDMSFVGPRPLLVRYLDRYTAEQARRHDVRPGLTGWAQVNGRNAISWEDKFKLDVWYVDHWNLWLDFKILWMTFIKVFRREGIQAADHATMEEFMGTENKGGIK
ncbi:sugar transferase [Clostridium aminobutyricum]|uniref:Sugar transferase n=1 Tax=Clostridium aminobutyricum TaxID=33953 RepID=A0A939DAB5_CLOAM|nr:sugar transferase [Clostridium aminobutyricum]MBN7774066.1 sugar transferase [Clostridium aminobutyricum]